MLKNYLKKRIMVKNYLKIAFRNIFRNKLFSTINIVGLAVGIAGSLLILMYVSGQLGYESMHENRAHIYRVSLIFGTGQSSIKMAGAFPALGPAASSDIPEVKEAVRFRPAGDVVIKAGNKSFKENRLFFSDSNVFKVFTFPLIEGNKNTALNNLSSIVISENTARKYFGNSDPLGKTLIFNGKYQFTITGVMKNVPGNTMLRCSILAPYSRLREIEKTKMPWMQWGKDFTFLYLKNNASISDIGKKLNVIYRKNTNEVMARMMKFAIIPLSSIHFNSDFMGELGPTGSYTTVYLFSSIAFLVLLIACLNYINLSTARSLRRSKEVGMRKVLGAGRGKLIRQFLAESVIITFISLIIGLVIYRLANPLLAEYFDINPGGSAFFDVRFLIVLLSVFISVNLIAGIYPAVFLSRFKPVDSLKSLKLRGFSRSELRKILVTLQFVITIFLIIATAAIYKQLNFMRNSKLGFDKKNVIVINYPVKEKKSAAKYLVLKNRINSIPGVIAVSGAYTLPGISNKETQSIQLPGGSAKDFPMFRAVGVDFDFVHALGLQLLKGRNFTKKYASDSTVAIILNQTAVKELNLKNPVGTEVYIPGKNNTRKSVKIIGVVSDFHLSSFYNKIEPLFLYINPARYYNIAVKLNAGNTSKIIGELRNSWEKIFPGREFDYSFLAQTYDNLYKSDQNTGNLFTVFAVLSVMIACMGLFGLVSYSIEVRTKEIGIRKTLGADIKDIVILLSKDFIKWTVIANIFAWPLAYYAVSKWLEDFAYKTDIGIAIFLISGSAAFLVALITIGIQAIKASSANPIEALRYE